MSDLHDVEEMAGEFDDGNDGIAEADMPVELVGFSFKKLKKFAKKNVLRAVNPIEHLKMTAKLAQGVARTVVKNPATAVFPPAAAFKLLKDAKRKRPVALAKVEAIKQAAGQGDPAAEAVYTNMIVANEVEKAGVQPEQVYPEFPPDDVPYEEYMQSETGEDVGEYYDDGPVDAVGSLWSKIKKLGPTLDFTNPKNPIRSAVTSIPLIGPGVVTAGDMLAKAKSGAKDALSKIDQVKKLAASGDPTAKKALANLMTANALDKAAEAGVDAGSRVRKVYDWMPGIKLYRTGMGTKTV